MPILQNKIEELFEATNMLTLHGKLKKCTYQLILSMMTVKVLKMKNAKNEIVAIWRGHVRKFKNDRKNIKDEITRMPDQSELQRLLTEASLAYKSMIAVNEISQTEGQNAEDFCRIIYRRQLRASHLKIIDRMKKYNVVIRKKSLNTIQY